MRKGKVEGNEIQLDSQLQMLPGGMGGFIPGPRMAFTAKRPVAAEPNVALRWCYRSCGRGGPIAHRPPSWSKHSDPMPIERRGPVGTRPPILTSGGSV